MIVPFPPRKPPDEPECRRTGYVPGSEIPSLLSTVDGRLDVDAIGEVADQIFLHLADVFPENMPVIAAAWPEIVERFATCTLPDFTDLRAGRHQTKIL